jgi:hypothetical protein
MTHGEMMYLALSIGAISVFVFCVGFISWWSARK